MQFALQEPNYDIDTLAALLSPSSKCAHNLLQLSSEFAASQTGRSRPKGTELGEGDTGTSEVGGCDLDIETSYSSNSMPVFF